MTALCFSTLLCGPLPAKAQQSVAPANQATENRAALSNAFFTSANKPASETPAGSLPDAPSAAGSTLRLNPATDERPLVLPRNFRITPAASRSNLPGKVSYYLGSTWSPRLILEALATSGVPDITAAPTPPVVPTSDDPIIDKQYQHDMDDYSHNIDTWRRVNEATLRYHGRRAAVGLATGESRMLLSNLVLPVALHQQARYIPAPINAGFGDRMWNAVTSIVVTQNDAGMVVPNYSKLGGTVGAAFLGKSLFADAFDAPELNSGHYAMHYIGYSLLGDLATNTTHELIRAAIEPDLTMYERYGRATDDDYYPLSAGGKLMYWVRSTYAPRIFITAGLIGGIPNIPSEPEEPQDKQPSTWNGYPTYDDAYNNYGTTLFAWKDGIENDARYHARRIGAGAAEAETQAMLQNLVIPIAFSMDPRYVPMGPGHGFGQRLGHAFEGLAICHTDSGAKTVNLPVLGGAVGAAYLAKEVYYPQLDAPALETGAVLGKTLALNFIGDAIYNVIGEFLRHRGY